jgi:hypothetical protein
MKRPLLVATLALSVLCIAPHGSVGALETVEHVDGGTMPVSQTTRFDVPSAQPDVVSRVPETTPRSSSTEAPAVPESVTLKATAPESTTSEMLAALTSDEKANALISLEPMGQPNDAQLLAGEQAERDWASGRYTEAIGQLENLERSGQPFAVLISWKQAVPAANPTEYYPDALISSRTGGEDLALAYHQGSSNIFAMVVWDEGWSLHMSTDLGATWSETHFWGGYAAIADMAIVGDHVWVGYSATGDSYHTSRFRRFFAATGSEDAIYNFQIVGNAGANTMTEIVVTGNTPDNNNRIYMTYLVSETDSIHFWWDDLDGTSFAEVPTGITDAQAGFDMVWNPYTPSGYILWVSYHSTDGRVRVVRSNGPGWNQEISHTFTGAFQRTALSAYGDHIICGFECESEPGKLGVCFLESSDAGVGAWHYDDAYWPTGSEVSGYNPDFAVHSGASAAAVFSSETGDLDDVYYVTRSEAVPGPWTDPTWYNTHDHLSGDETYIEWIGSLCVSSYGMAYFDEDGPRRPYFDLMTPRGFFCDGFESGNANAWN